MNVFRKKSKAKDQAANFVSRNNAPEPLPGLPKFSRTPQRNEFQFQPLPKLDFSLDAALPAQNDFRMSLMMPQLSARFSMLREQDDPTTKIGKANDDSVLFPKRASKLNLFKNNPLLDITEIDSPSSMTKRTYMDDDRSNSITDGYHSDETGSIMSRARPAEGNNTFGGRQKLYKVPAEGNNSKNGSGSLGKHMYESDISMSMFQQYRQEARENAKLNADSRQQNTRPYENEDYNGYNSTSTLYDRSRATTSSTTSTSGPSHRRTSTAATSVTSEPPIPRQNGTMPYLNGYKSSAFDPSIEDSSLRNNSFDFRRGYSVKDDDPPPMPAALTLNKNPTLSKPTTTFNDKYSKSTPFSTNNIRTVSPPPSLNTQGLSGLDFGLSESTQKNGPQTRRYQTTSPIAPASPQDEESNIYNRNLQPNDRGKATALGLFNRPAQQYDEERFLERQRQMHEGWNSSFSPDMQAEKAPTPGMATANYRSQESSTTVRLNTDRKYSGPHSTGIPSPVSQSSDSTSRPWNQSNTSLASGGTSIVKARVESLIRRQNAELATMGPGRSLAPKPSPAYSASTGYGFKKSGQSNVATFFNNMDMSDDEDVRQKAHNVDFRNTPADIHPALRNAPGDFNVNHAPITPRIPDRRSDTSNYSVSPPYNYQFELSQENVQQLSQARVPDSPTIGFTAGLGLSGMVRTHLRHDSDRSSVYPDSPRHAPRPPSFSLRQNNTQERAPSNPWEHENANSSHKDIRRPSQPSDNAQPLSPKALQILGYTSPQINQTSSKVQQILGHDAPVRSEEPLFLRPWQDQAIAKHKRAESSATQKERQDFEEELAERRRKVQEGLKVSSESEQRAKSPYGRNEQQHHPMQGILSPPLPNRGFEVQSKALKMLGISASDIDNEYDPYNARNDFSSYQPPPQYKKPSPPPEPDHTNGRRTPGANSEGRRTPGDGRRTPGDGRRTPGDGRRTPGDNRKQSEEFDRRKQRSATPTSGNNRGPERANSNQKRQEANKTTPDMPQRQASGGSQKGGRYERSASAMSGRSRSASRTNGGEPFDIRPPPTPPIPLAQIPIAAPRPSPRPPYPNSPLFTTTNSAANSAAPSPMFPPIQRPPSAGRTTPNGGRVTPSGKRKQSVNKTMISEPTFISSTASVPLVGLPDHPGPRSRSRSNTASDKDKPTNSPAMMPNQNEPPVPSLYKLYGPPPPKLPPNEINNDYPPVPPLHKYFGVSDVAAAAQRAHLGQPTPVSANYGVAVSSNGNQPVQRPPAFRQRLRKTSSEGGNMSSTARQQALMLEFDRERNLAPMLPVFPNRSATSLGVRFDDGGMF